MCVRVIILMKILNESDMRPRTGGSDSSMSTRALTPRSYFGSSKVESLEIKTVFSAFVLLSFLKLLNLHLNAFKSCFITTAI